MNFNEEEIKQELKCFIGEDPILYLKHVREEEWAKDIYSGKLFMNTVKFFRELEENSGIRGQGDRHELIQRLEITNGKIINNDTNEVFLEFGSANASIEIEGDKDVYIYCASAITLDDLELLERNESSVTFKLPFDEEVIKDLKKDFGEYVVLISGPGFRSRIDSLISHNKLKAIFRKVKYCETNALQKVEAFNISSAERFFYKDIDLAYQKEYRLAVNKEFIKDGYLDIGTIKEIAYICKIDDLAKYVLSYNLV